MKGTCLPQAHNKPLYGLLSHCFMIMVYPGLSWTRCSALTLAELQPCDKKTIMHFPLLCLLSHCMLQTGSCEVAMELNDLCNTWISTYSHNYFMKSSGVVSTLPYKVLGSVFYFWDNLILLINEDTWIRSDSNTL